MESCPLDDQSFEYSLLEVLDDCFYTQNVRDPTFQVSRHDSKNVLDLVITECPERIYNITHGPPLGLLERGHHSLTWNYELKSRKKRDTKFTSSSFNYRKGDFESLSRFINEVKWDHILSNLTVDQMFDKFRSY